MPDAYHLESLVSCLYSVYCLLFSILCAFAALRETPFFGSCLDRSAGLVRVRDHSGVRLRLLGFAGIVRDREVTPTSTLM